MVMFGRRKIKKERFYNVYLVKYKKRRITFSHLIKEKNYSQDKITQSDEYVEILKTTDRSLECD